MREWIKCVVVFVVLSAITGCAGRTTGRAEVEGDSLYVPRYAAGFALRSVGKSSILSVKNPWQGAQNIDMEVFISRNGESAPVGFDGVTLCGPLRRVVCMSSSYVAFIDAIGCVDAVAGVSGVRFITNDKIRQRQAEGLVKDVGYDTNLNFELITSIEPDVVMIYGVAGENTMLSDKLRELGINVIYIGDYLEESPLGKAEWIVAIGEMFDRRAEAEAIFDGVESEYNLLRESAVGAQTHPKVMLNAPWRDTWFVPGDRSYMVRLINDAGGEYAAAGVDSQVSRPISGESAFVIASGADIWLSPNQAGSIADVVALNPNFKDIPAVKNRRVYNNTKRNTAEGGSDFWESGAVYPNVVLRDMIIMLHPELTKEGSLYYFKQLE